MANKKAAPKAKVKKKKPVKTMGRPTIWNAEKRRVIEILAKKGFTDEEIADVIGTTQQTFNNWKKKYPDFFESVKDWKIEADEKVVRSLYERATGFVATETTEKIIPVKGGKQLLVEKMVRTKHFAPDPTSMIFWLKNRKNEEWKDRIDHSALGKDGQPVEWNVNVVHTSKESIEVEQNSGKDDNS